MKHTACYHLPGTLRVHQLYRLVLSLFRSTGNIFMRLVRDRLHLRRCRIASGVGAAWRPGRALPAEVLADQEYGISARLTFSIPCRRSTSQTGCMQRVSSLPKRGTVQNGSSSTPSCF